jgi:hypothetical protein
VSWLSRLDRSCLRAPRRGSPVGPSDSDVSSATSSIRCRHRRSSRSRVSTREGSWSGRLPALRAPDARNVVAHCSSNLAVVPDVTSSAWRAGSAPGAVGLVRCGKELVKRHGSVTPLTDAVAAGVHPPHRRLAFGQPGVCGGASTLGSHTDRAARALPRCRGRRLHGHRGQDLHLPGPEVLQAVAQLQPLQRGQRVGDDHAAFPSLQGLPGRGARSGMSLQCHLGGCSVGASRMENEWRGPLPATGRSREPVGTSAESTSRIRAGCRR